MTDTGCLRVGQQAPGCSHRSGGPRVQGSHPVPVPGQVCGAVLLSAGLHLRLPD